MSEAAWKIIGKLVVGLTIIGVLVVLNLRFHDRDKLQAEIATECIKAGKVWSGWMGGTCKDKLASE